MVSWHYWLNGHEFEQAPGVGDGRGGLVCCSPWGHKELDMIERPNKKKKPHQWISERSAWSWFQQGFGFAVSVEGESRNWRWIAHDGRVTEKRRRVDPGASRKARHDFRIHPMVLIILFSESRQWGLMCVSPDVTISGVLWMATAVGLVWIPVTFTMESDSALGTCPPEILHQSQHRPACQRRESLTKYTSPDSYVFPGF